MHTTTWKRPHAQKFFPQLTMKCPRRADRNGKSHETSNRRNVVTSTRRTGRNGRKSQAAETSDRRTVGPSRRRTGDKSNRRTLEQAETTEPAEPFKLKPPNCRDIESSNCSKTPYSVKLVFTFGFTTTVCFGDMKNDHRWWKIFNAT